MPGNTEKTGARRGVLTDDMFGPAIESPGDDIVERAWEAKSKAQRRKLARKALDADLDCIDAYVLLALDADSLAEEIALNREAVRVGERLFAPLFDEEDMHWWGFVGTRPWMRAMHHLALALEGAGETEEPEAIYRRLLDLNPNDNQGARYLLLRILCKGRRVKDCRALMAEHPEDWSVDFAMAALWADLRDGRKATAKRLKAVDEMNPHALPLLLDVLDGAPPPTDEPIFIEPGGRSEAEGYVSGYADIWRNDPKVAKALREGMARRTRGDA